MCRSAWTNGGVNGQSFWQWSYNLSNSSASPACCNLGLTGSAACTPAQQINQVWNVTDTGNQRTSGSVCSANQ